MEENEKEMIICEKKYKFIFLLIIILFLYLMMASKLKNYTYNNKQLFFNNEYLNNSEYFKITFMKYSFSFKYKMIKIEYNIGFFDKNNNLILPSGLTLYKNLHIICNIIIKDNKSINSLANIYKNKYYNCIEFCNINEKIQFGIVIYRLNKNIEYTTINFFNEKIFNFKNLYNHFNNIFEPLLINNEYNLLNKKIIKKELNKNLKLKKSYMKYPYCSLKRSITLFENKWILGNIYNHYFCFCFGYNCFGKNSSEICKYYY